jgi:hypothetical protein
MRHWAASAEEEFTTGDSDAKQGHGRPVTDIAAAFYRTRRSIASRLVRLGKAPDRQSALVANLHSTSNRH